MSRLNLPPSARVAIGTVRGQNGPLELFVSPEWARYFDSLNTLSNNTAYGPGGVADINADDTWHDDLNAREAMMAVDELRNEIASLRGENNALRQRVDDLEATAGEARQPADFRLRIEQIEDRLQ